ncbi:ankyrin repeat-containing protein At5g02620-like isoform X2 [Punica granatum]|uniref:Ankyrin repeat-containing protein At5g02620-like isoform X2 n=1 Tax=Punica granatum TaxID=22663 RepID=A0A6P8D094_PUNGR|nr:ankyrin repeat-containing protein At5g02620-like isoform X2 [Punica granatum]
MVAHRLRKAYSGRDSDHSPPSYPDNGDDLRRYQDLYKAALAGDWETAEGTFKSDPDAKTARISLGPETALLLAISMGRTQFIKKLVQRLSPEDLEMTDSNGQTALHFAAMYGSLDVVKTLIDRHRTLTQIINAEGFTALHTAAIFNRKEVTQYLTLKTTDDHPGCPFTGPKAGSLIQALVWSGSYVLPVEVEHDHTPRCLLSNDVEAPQVNPQIPPTSTTYWTRVRQWSIKTAGKAQDYFAFGAIKCIKDEKYKHKCTQKLVEVTCKVIADRLTPREINQFFASQNILRRAAMSGIVEIISICLENFPYLIWVKSTFAATLQSAVALRQEKVLNLMLEQSAFTKALSNEKDGCGPKILRSAAKLSPYPELSSVSCPALQMQRELQWFKAVEEFVHPQVREHKDKGGRIVGELFTRKHRRLLRDAEKWMKDTSSSCMVVSTLIATVVFAAAFTVPGGNVDGKGIPLFLNERVFMLFAVSDALALFSSTTSILMFLSILTARFAEEDFLRALPKRLILGFTSLFLALATMMVAFGATLYMVVSERFKWILFPITALTAIPVALFAMLQLPLLIFMVQSTYFPRIFHPKKIW